MLNNNKLRHIDEFTFKGMEKNLEEFHLERNRIRTLAPFARFEALKVFLMTYNRVGELGEFERLNGSRLALTIEEVSFARNPVAKKPFYRFIVAQTLGRVLR